MKNKKLNKRIGMWKKNFTFSIILICSFFPLLVLSAPADDEVSVTINTAINVDSDGTIFIEGNLYGNENFNSEGQITVSSSSLSEVLLPSEITGSGEVNLEGDGDYEVTTIGDSYLANLIVNTTGDVYVDGNVTVYEQLQLLNGIVDVTTPYVLLAESSDEDAVLFDETDYDKSYVIGYLGRAVNSGQTRYYPIGDDEGAFPLYLKEPETSDILVAMYDKTIATNAGMADIGGFDLFSESGWQVYSGNGYDNQYAVGVWAPEQFEVGGTAGIMRSEIFDFSDYSVIWECENSSDSYLATKSATTNGYFALIEDDGSEDDLILRNFFVVGNGNETIFEIPGSSAYSSIELTLYNRLGQRLFYAYPYSNQLDLQNYPTGTYFYELILKKNKNVQKIYNFIEVKNEDF